MHGRHTLHTVKNLLILSTTYVQIHNILGMKIC